MTRWIFTVFLLALIASSAMLPAQAQIHTPFGNIPVGGSKQPVLQGLVAQAEATLTRQAGEAVGVGSPLRLDPQTAYAPASDPTDFHPTVLHPVSVEDLNKRLPPGDYTVDVTAFGTPFSTHAPGQNVPYRLARVQGKQADIISALIVRGTVQNVSPATINADAWRIQSGLPLSQWPPDNQALVHQLIPEYAKRLEGDYLQHIQSTYNQLDTGSRALAGKSLPPLETLLAGSDAGRSVLRLFKARQVLADKTLAAERIPDMLSESTGDGLTRALPASPVAVSDASPSSWAEIRPGVLARFTVIEGDLGRNQFEFRIMPGALQASSGSRGDTTHGLTTAAFVQPNLPTAQTAQQVPAAGLSLAEVMGAAPYLGTAAGTAGGSGGAGLLIGYGVGTTGTQALILMWQPQGKASNDNRVSNNGD